MYVAIRSDRDAWLALAAAYGVGPRTADALVRAFRSPRRAATATAAEIARLPGFSGDRAEGLARALSEADPQAILADAARAGLTVVTRADPDYPPTLASNGDAPAALFVKGTLPSPAAPWAAIVGTRAASPYGLRVARSLATDLARDGVVVVSGLARGVDAAAHEAAIAAGGKTVAVLGCGADVVYPPEHAALAADVASHGALVSEHPPGTPPLRGHFPRRNRIVAGLAKAVVVVEAPEASGALVTARLAGEYGRDVLAVPGPVDRGTHSGCHRLIRDGVRLCEDANDVRKALGMGLAPSASLGAPSRAADAPPPPPGPPLAVWQVLDRDDAIDLDEICRRTGLSPDAVASGVTSLELDGRVVRVPGVGIRRAG